MILHFFEVWLLLFMVFTIGCGLGALIHIGLASGPAAAAQDDFARMVGESLDRLKWRLGLAPEWRPESRRTYAWPDLTPDGDTPVTPEPAEIEVAAQTWSSDAPSEEDAWDEDVEGTDEFVAGEGVEADVEPLADFVEAETEPSETEVMRRPPALAEPRAGVPDNLQRIWGIGKRNEALLNSLGIFHFGQIASWTPAEARWVASQLTFPERLERDNWIGQAIVLATGGDPSTVNSPNRKKLPKPTDDQ